MPKPMHSEIYATRDSWQRERDMTRRTRIQNFDARYTANSYGVASYLKQISIEQRNENTTTGSIKNTMFYASIQVTQFRP